jgi:hypothetical protein
MTRGRELAEWLVPLARGSFERAATGLPQKVRVGWYDAIDASRCPAGYREGVAEGGTWQGWAPHLAARSIGRAALTAYVESGATELPQPLDLVRAHVRQVRHAPARNVDDWLADPQLPDAERRLAGSLATRWLSSFLRMTGWPLPARLSLDDVRPFRHDLVTAAASIDATAGKVTVDGTHELWVLITSSGRGVSVLRDRACVDAAAATLGRGIAPAAFVLLCADTGERLRLPIERDELARGVELLTIAVRELRGAATRGWDESDAIPGEHCPTCHVLGRCPPGERHLDAPGRRRGGLPVLDREHAAARD